MAKLVQSAEILRTPETAVVAYTLELDSVHETETMMLTSTPVPAIGDKDHAGLTLRVKNIIWLSPTIIGGTNQQAIYYVVIACYGRPDANA